MSLPSAPPISMSQIASELGVSLPLSLTDSRVRQLAGIPSGNISILDLLGKSNTPTTAMFVESSPSGQFAGKSGFSDGVPRQGGPPDPAFIFGSMAGNAIGPYTMSAVYSDLSATAVATGHLVTSLTYGAGFLTGKSLRIISGGTIITDAGLTFFDVIGGTTSYTFAFDFSPYLAQTLTLMII